MSVAYSLTTEVSFSYFSHTEDALTYIQQMVLSPTNNHLDTKTVALQKTYMTALKYYLQLASYFEKDFFEQNARGLSIWLYQVPRLDAPQVRPKHCHNVRGPHRNAGIVEEKTSLCDTMDLLFMCISLHFP